MNSHKYEVPRNNGDESLAWRIAIVAAFSILAVAVTIICGGCDRGDFRATMVAEGQAAPHDGFNIGPDIWVTEGQPVKLQGAVLWIKNIDPNSLIAGE